MGVSGKGVAGYLSPGGGDMNKYIKERSSTMEMTRPNYGMLLGVFLYHLILDLSYVCFVVPYYGYNGFDLNLNPVKLAESYIWCFGLYFLLSKKEGNVSAFFLNLEFLVMLIPMLSYYALADQSRYFMYLICLCFLMQIAVLKISPIHFPYFKGYFQFFLAMLLVFSLVVLCVAIIYNGIPTLRAFDFSNIYEIRAESRTPALFGYFINWVCKVIVPFCLYFQFIIIVGFCSIFLYLFNC